MNALEQKIIEIAFGENSLSAMARTAHDPGSDYFSQLIVDLECLFLHTQGQVELNKELVHALFSIAHYPYIEYTNAVSHGKTFRDTLFDPQLIALEMAVDSIFSGEWQPYLEN